MRRCGARWRVHLIFFFGGGGGLGLHGENVLFKLDPYVVFTRVKYAHFWPASSVKGRGCPVFGTCFQMFPIGPGEIEAKSRTRPSLECDVSLSEYGNGPRDGGDEW